MSQLKKEDLSIKEENKESPYDTVIQRKNLVNEFTVADIARHIQTLHKMDKEAVAAIRLAKASKENIERHHGELIDSLDEKQKHHVYMWYEQFQQLQEIEPKQKEIEEELHKHNEYIDIICEAFGFERPNTDPAVVEGFVPKEEGEKKTKKVKRKKDGGKS